MESKTTYPPHRFAELFPVLAEARLEELAEDIRVNGLLSPIVLFQGYVLDGRNRMRACEIAGVEPRFEDFRGSEEQALARVLSSNLHRRQLTETQRAALALDVLPIKAEFARQRMLAGTKVDPPAHVREGVETQKGEAVELAAKEVGVGATSVRKVLKIKNRAPDAVEALRAGLVESIPQAEALAAMPEPERKEILEQPKSEIAKKLRDSVKRIKTASKSSVTASKSTTTPTDAEIETAVETLLGLVGRLAAPRAKTLRGQIVSRLDKVLRELVKAEKGKGKKSGAGSDRGSKAKKSAKPTSARAPKVRGTQATEPIEPLSSVFDQSSSI